MRTDHPSMPVLLCLALAASFATAAQPVTITVRSEVLATIGADFSGVHYDGPTHRSWMTCISRSLTCLARSRRPTAGSGFVPQVLDSRASS